MRLQEPRAAGPQAWQHPCSRGAGVQDVWGSVGRGGRVPGLGGDHAELLRCRPRAREPRRHSPVPGGFSWGLSSSSLGDTNHRGDKMTPELLKEPFHVDGKGSRLTTPWTFEVGFSESAFTTWKLCLPVASLCKLRHAMQASLCLFSESQTVWTRGGIKPSCLVGTEPPEGTRGPGDVPLSLWESQFYAVLKRLAPRSPRGDVPSPRLHLLREHKLSPQEKQGGGAVISLPPTDNLHMETGTLGVPLYVSKRGAFGNPRKLQDEAAR